ncbi:MAG TPA: metal-dependent transcriptional regulator [Trueperaceae bacterium]
MPNPSASSNISSSVGDYLKAIWILGGGKLVTTRALAEHLGISPASVSGMLGRLQETGLILHERYRGVRLTQAGQSEALRLLRRHRLLETFMIEHLGYGWDEVHDEAESIEHAISDRFTERLAILLDRPSHDPHGDPIPNADGTLPDTPNTPLAEVAIGETLEVARLLTQDADLLTYLANLGISPGRHVEVVGREPLGGLVNVVISGQREVLSKELALLVRGAVMT